MKKLYFLLIFILFFSLHSCEDVEEYPYYIKYTGIDFLVVRYYWNSATEGVDLDTRTAIVDPNRNVDVGWARGAMDEDFLEWGGDNTGGGYEAVLITLRQLATEYPREGIFDIRMRAYWYKTRLSGNIHIEFTGYDGGKMVKSGYNWVNEGGVQLDQVTVDRNIMTQQSSNIDGEEAGIARYHVSSEELEILDP